MSKKKKKTDKAEKKAKVHKELEGFEIKINPLGEITSSYSIDQLNEFLDKNVYDKKLTDKGLEKPGGKPAKDDEDDYHVEETEEEEENPEDFIAPAPRAKNGKKIPKTKDDKADETDEDEDDLDDLPEDEEVRPKK